MFAFCLFTFCSAQALCTAPWDGPEEQELDEEDLGVQEASLASASREGDESDEENEETQQEDGRTTAVDPLLAVLQDESPEAWLMSRLRRLRERQRLRGRKRFKVPGAPQIRGRFVGGFTDSLPVFSGQFCLTKFESTNSSLCEATAPPVAASGGAGATADIAAAAASSSTATDARDQSLPRPSSK